MTKRGEMYRCQDGGIVEIVNAAGARPECGGKPMELLEENVTDAAKEKHVPVIEKIDGGYKVKVGSVEHPMLENHYIQWIELIEEGDKIQRKYLKPGDKPEAVFYTDSKNVSAREYCNLHGLWKG